MFYAKENFTLLLFLSKHLYIILFIDDDVRVIKDLKACKEKQALLEKRETRAGLVDLEIQDLKDHRYGNFRFLVL